MSKCAIRQFVVGATLMQSITATALDELPVAYMVVAKAANVPADILYAVALAESGRSYNGVLLPWPWTLNVEGRSIFCGSQGEAIVLAAEAINRKQLVDLGLTQVNWRWHQQRFTRVDDALVPMLNLKAGAAILREQYEVSGDWWQAVGRYHDPGQDDESLASAESYRQRVKRLWRGAF
ncbi:MAG: transglycosylase SLT domain-containing protein [Motiliproteus sp.]|nr:transglycosylase SLT domain-containing protein [Motiliproteus sp.]MCW9050931.1 transglycosylase SLT domain-containing protein [Motiliproteus sp.]